MPHFQPAAIGTPQVHRYVLRAAMDSGPEALATGSPAMPTRYTRRLTLERYLCERFRP